MKVNFLKQGGKVIEGDAIGRQGKSQFLIQYRIESGEARERWIKADRVVGTEQWDKRIQREDADQDEKRPGTSTIEIFQGLVLLPRYSKRDCPGKADWYDNCPVCGTRITKKSGEHKILAKIDFRVEEGEPRRSSA